MCIFLLKNISVNTFWLKFGLTCPALDINAFLVCWHIHSLLVRLARLD